MSEERHSSSYEDLVEDKPKKKEKVKFNFNFKSIKLNKIPVAGYLLIIFLLFVFIIPSALRFIRGFGVSKEYDYMAGKDFIAAPIQEPIDKDEELYEVQNIDGYTFKIKKLAKYAVSGRVVNVQDYLGYDVVNRFSPRDFTLAYGLYANKDNTKGIIFYSLHDRFVHYHMLSSNKISELGGPNRFYLSVSNNHIIPADKKVRKLMYKVKEDDYIRVEGFLVSVYYDNNEKNVVNTGLWSSSTRRNDTGAGACEIILVKNIVWLKEP